MANVPITSLPEATAPSTGDYLILQGASTQRIKWSALLDKLYPVGCIYQSAIATSPAELFGGTWGRIKDRFLLAAGDTYAEGTTGGKAENTLTPDQLPKHTHKTDKTSTWPINSSFEEWTSIYKLTSSSEVPFTRWSTETGPNDTSNAPVNNMPPYSAVYVWQRIA